MAAPLLLRGVPVLRLWLQHQKLDVTLTLFTRRPSCTSVEWTRPDDNLSFAVQATSQFRPKVPPSYRRIDDPDYRRWKDKEEEILKDIEPITLLAKEIIHSSSGSNEVSGRAVDSDVLGSNPTCNNCQGRNVHGATDRPAQAGKQTASVRAVEISPTAIGKLHIKKKKKKREKLFISSLSRSVKCSLLEYMDGERLTLKDEKIVVEKLLAYHPHFEDKIGCGLDSIMVDQHPQFRQSRCLFVLRTDGGWIDFSYQKCVRAYIRHKYPSYAEKFIREHYKRGSS